MAAPAPRSPQQDVWTHAKAIEWFKSLGFVPTCEGSETWGIAWSQRSGYDFTDLEFYPLRRHANDAGWDAIVGHHASGTNPRLIVGTCETRADVEMIYETLRLLNGYKEPEPHRSASPRTQEQEPTDNS